MAFTTDEKLQQIEQWLSLGDAESIWNLIQAMESDPDHMLRGEAARALGNTGNAAVVEPLIGALSNESRHARVTAADALGKLADERAVEPLIAALADREGPVRIKVVEALGRIGDDRAVKGLVEALKDRSASVRMLAAEALGRIGHDSAIQPLLNAMNNANTMVRRPTMEALAKIADVTAIDPLIARLEDSSWEVCWTAAEALSNVGHPRALPALLAWTHTMFVSETKRLSKDDKIGMISPVLTGYFSRIPAEDLELAAIKLRPTQRIVFWNGRPDGTGQWVAEEIPNPLMDMIQKAQDGAQRPEDAPLAPGLGAASAAAPGPMAGALEERDGAAGGGDQTRVISSENFHFPEGASPGARSSRISYAPDMDELIESAERAEQSVATAAALQTPRKAASQSDGFRLPAAEESESFTPGRPGPLVEQFLELLRNKGLETAALVGGTARDLYLGRQPNDLDFTFQARLTPELAQKSSDPVAWNLQFAALVHEPLRRLASALDVTLGDLIAGRAEFSGPDGTIPIHYVGPYLIEEKHLVWEELQVEQRIRRSMSRLALIADINSRRLIGAAGSTNADMLWLDSNGAWRGDMEMAEQALRFKVIRTSVSHLPLSGLSDIFHLIYLRRSLAAKLSESAIESVLGAATLCKQGPEHAKATFTRAGLERLLRTGSFKELLADFAMLDLTEVLSGLLDSTRLIEMNEYLEGVAREGDNALREARADVEAAEAERNALKQDFEAQRRIFSLHADKLDVSQATINDLDQRLRDQIRLLVPAEEAARSAGDRLEGATVRLRQFREGDDMDVGALQEHREALADKRERDAEALSLKQEVESLRMAGDRRQTSTIDLQTEVEQIGQSLEQKHHAFQEARARHEFALRRLEELDSTFNMTPERRRARLREPWTPAR